MKRFVSRILISMLVAGAILSIALVFLGGGHSIESAQTPSEVSLLATEKMANVTDLVTSNIAKAIAEKNPQGPTLTTSTASIVLNANEIMKQALDEARAEAAEHPLEPNITVSMLAIDKDTSTHAQRAYLTSLSAIVDKHLKNSLLNSTNPQYSNFDAMASAREKAFDELLALPVPAPLANYHQRFLTLLGTQRNIFALLAHAQEDPIRSLWAAQAAPLVAENATELTHDLQEYISVQHL
jgi:hypothetical protein